ncbi:MAG TPA: hypothetical protein PK402_04495 [Tepidisphaeraceae bacterium]|nr:hypothetical protein [Tepidisphaeraceae bacterium]
MLFCTDADLLLWEPNLAREASFASQTKLTTTGSIAGEKLTIASGNLTTSGVAIDDIVSVEGDLVGCFPVVGIESATICDLTVITQNAYENGQPTPLPSASDLDLRFCTFYAQRRVVSDVMLSLANLTEAQAQRIMNPGTLRRAAVLGTLQMIYSALAAVAGESSAELQVRASLYERLYRRAIRVVQIELDLDEDGQADCARQLNVIQLQRRG